MKPTLFIVTFFLAISISIGVTSCLHKTDKKNIITWVTTHDEIVKDIDYRIWKIGPYWHVEEARYYRVETDKNIYWFKFYLWDDCIKKEIRGGKYETVKD